MAVVWFFFMLNAYVKLPHHDGPSMAAKYLTPALAGTRARNSKPSPFAATSKAETSKHSKYDRPIASMNPP